MTIQRFMKGTQRYEYGYKFRKNHISDKTGNALKEHSNTRKGTTVVNRVSLEADTFTPVKVASYYDFGLAADNVEAYHSGFKRSTVHFAGYNDIDNTGAYRKITHLDYRM